jgi:chemotaxis protein histidine kinase CheA
MSEGPGFLEFFILEASDYVEQLDGLLLGGGSSGPDADALQRVARALRGTATMAKIPSFADLAGSIERVGRAMHDGVLGWDPALGGALVAAVDDLKILLHGARTWSAEEDRRAGSRSAELSRYAPARAAATNASSGAGSSFLATEAANIAAGLELLTTRPGDPDTAANVLKRVRALRGVAGVKEIIPLADALEATEDAGRSLETGRGVLSAEARGLLESAAAFLRTLSAALRTGADANLPNPARDAFEAARETWSTHDTERERVVPISALFYADDASGLVETSAHPPTTASQRFHLELVSLGEHLRQVVIAARAARDPAAKSRVQRDLRRALKALESAAESFGEHEVGEFIRAHANAPNNLDFLDVSALDDLASVLAEPGAGGERLRARLHELAGGRDIADAIGAGFGRATPLSTPAMQATAAPAIAEPPVSPASAPAAAAAPSTVPEPAPVWAVQPPVQPAAAPPPSEKPAANVAAAAASTESLDHGSAWLIDSSIAALESISSKPLIPQIPLPGEEGELVPIEALLYRGRAALDRALEIRDKIRGGSPDLDALDELYDLLELARAE